MQIHRPSRFIQNPDSVFTCNDENNEKVSCLPAKYQHPGTLGWQRLKRQRLLKKSFCGGSSSRFSQLAPGGGTYQRLSEARWSAHSWRRAALSMDPSGARISKFLLRVWRCRLFTALWSLLWSLLLAGLYSGLYCSLVTFSPSRCCSVERSWR